MNEFVTKLPKNYKFKYKGKNGLQCHHLLYGSGRRKFSDYYGLILYCTQAEHEWYHKNKEESCKIGQKLFEQTYSREQFMQVFGKNYL